jgi:hypothetical protein
LPTSNPTTSPSVGRVQLHASDTFVKSIQSPSKASQPASQPASQASLPTQIAIPSPASRLPAPAQQQASLQNSRLLALKPPGCNLSIGPTAFLFKVGSAFSPASPASPSRLLASCLQAFCRAHSLPLKGGSAISPASPASQPAQQPASPAGCQPSQSPQAAGLEAASFL